MSKLQKQVQTILQSYNAILCKISKKGEIKKMSNEIVEITIKKPDIKVECHKFVKFSKKD